MRTITPHRTGAEWLGNGVCRVSVTASEKTGLRDRLFVDIGELVTHPFRGDISTQFYSVRCVTQSVDRST